MFYWSIFLYMENTEEVKIAFDKNDAHLFFSPCFYGVFVFVSSPHWSTIAWSPISTLFGFREIEHILSILASSGFL